MTEEIWNIIVDVIIVVGFIYCFFDIRKQFKSKRLDYTHFIEVWNIKNSSEIPHYSQTLERKKIKNFVELTERMGRETIAIFKIKYK